MQYGRILYKPIYLNIPVNIPLTSYPVNKKNIY